MELFKEYYEKGEYVWYYRKESGKNITFPFETKKYYYSKKQLLKECNKRIRDYIKNINEAISNAKDRVEKEKERIENLEELLSA